MLKFKIDSEAFEKLNEVEKTFYAQAGEGYQFQVEGAVDKSKIDEFRKKNIDLLQKQEQFKGVDLAKYRELEERERKIKNKELFEKGDIDALLEDNYKARDADWSAKNNTLSTENEELKKVNSSIISKYEIEGAAAKAFATHKINPDANDSVLAQIRAKFSVDNGQVVAKDGDSIIAGTNGNLTVDEFVGSLPEIFKIQSNGGQGKGNDSNQSMSQGKTSADRIKAGLAARMQN